MDFTEKCAIYGSLSNKSVPDASCPSSCVNVETTLIPASFLKKCEMELSMLIVISNYKMYCETTCEIDK